MFKRFMIWFWLLTKRMLRSPLMLFLLLIMPVGAAGVMIQTDGAGWNNSMYSSGASYEYAENVDAADTNNDVNIKSDSGPKAVLYISDEDETAKLIVGNLCSYDGIVSYYAVTDDEELYQDITSGKADFGYIFRDGFTRRLDEKSYKGAIRLVTEESSYITMISNEIVFKELFRVYALNIAVNYVESVSEFDSMRQQAVEEVKSRYSAYRDNDDISYFRFETADSEGGTAELEAVEVTFPVRGILGVMVMAAAMSGGVMYCRDRRKGVFAALTKRMTAAGAVLYVTVPTVLFAVSAEAALGILGEAVYPYEAEKMLLYAVILIIVNSVLAMVIKDASIFAGAIPVFLVASLVFCPIFFNITGVSAAVRYLNYLLPVSYYL